MPPKGFLFSGVNCGLKKAKPDLGIIYSENPANWAGVFTTNAFKSASVIVSQGKIDKKVRAIVVNSGNANAGTGKEGISDAEEMCSEVAKNLGIKEEEVLVASTGIIGERLPMEKIKEGIKRAIGKLSPDNFPKFAEAIMTTDKFPKIVERELDGGRASLLGIGKGAGMIHPKMATMLVFLLTDANIQSHQLKECLKEAVDVSFHCLSVDGDTSTNDSVFLLANGMSEMANIPSFQQALNEACVDLAKMIAKDGEGATKLILIKVRGSKSKEEAREVGRRIAVSPLVKTAFFGADPNVGRILCAIGNFPFEAPPSVDIFLSGEKVAENGMIIKFNKKKMRDFLKNKREIEVEINLKRGNSSAIVYTCDLSYDYVKINAEYTT